MHFQLWSEHNLLSVITIAAQMWPTMKSKFSKLWPSEECSWNKKAATAIHNRLSNIFPIGCNFIIEIRKRLYLKFELRQFNFSSCSSADTNDSVLLHFVDKEMLQFATTAMNCGDALVQQPIDCIKCGQLVELQQEADPTLVDIARVEANTGGYLTLKLCDQFQTSMEHKTCKVSHIC